MEESGLASGFSAEKVFCIGLSRTGTTSLEQALRDLGYRLGDQHQGELLLPQYAVRNFRPIVEFCLTADAFQDAPFSFPFIYLALDQRAHGGPDTLLGEAAHLGQRLGLG
jgi:hypothetical protein